MENSVERYPAPWNLRGRGYIILYRFKKNFVENSCNVPSFLKDKFVGGFGTMMLVDYSESNAGPYKELLFIPGKFYFNNKKLDIISKIYVSTNESVYNGRQNWGIPKELADFDYGDNRIIVSKDNQKILDISVRSNKLAFPVNTKLLPFPLVQEYDNKYFYTNFFGKGIGHFAHIDKININGELFPDISEIRPIVAIKVDPFSITFPEAKVETIKYEK